MVADKKALLDKMAMPKKPGGEDEMLDFSEADMEESSDEEMPASSADLTNVSDDELVAEAKKRGLLPESEEAMPESDTSEMDMEVEEA